MAKYTEWAQKRLEEIQSKDNCIEELQQLFNRLSNVTFWAELDSGENIKEGEEVRYFGKYYICIKAHPKALLRSPLNTEYWKETE